MGGGPASGGVHQVSGVIDGRSGVSSSSSSLGGGSSSLGSSASSSSKKKNKKGSGRERRRAAKENKNNKKKKWDDVDDSDDAGDGVEGFMASKKTRGGGSSKKSMFDPRGTIAIAATRLAALAFLWLVLCRRDFATAYGAGTGKNKVRVSPLTVTVMELNELAFVKSNPKLRRAVWKTSSTLMMPAIAEQRLFPKKSARRKKSKKKKKKQRVDDSIPIASAAEKDLIKVTKDKALKTVVRPNGFIRIGSIVVTFGAIFAAINPRAYFIAASGMVAFFVGTAGVGNASLVPLQQTTPFFYAGGIIVALYLLVPMDDDNGGKKSKKQ